MDINLLRLSPSARYALRGMLYLALQPEGRFCLVEESAATAKLPKDFLAKIFQKLAHGGLLLSKRGPGGGYALAKPADQIPLEDILRCLETSNLQENLCLLEEHVCDESHTCAIHESVIQATEILRGALQRMSLANLKQE